jgi:hypothetical protein
MYDRLEYDLNGEWFNAPNYRYKNCVNYILRKVIMVFCKNDYDYLVEQYDIMLCARKIQKVVCVPKNYVINIYYEIKIEEGTSNFYFNIQKELFPHFIKKYVCKIDYSCFDNEKNNKVFFMNSIIKYPNCKYRDVFRIDGHFLNFTLYDNSYHIKSLKLKKFKQFCAIKIMGIEIGLLKKKNVLYYIKNSNNLLMIDPTTLEIIDDNIIESINLSYIYEEDGKNYRDLTLESELHIQISKNSLFLSPSDYLLYFNKYVEVCEFPFLYK